MGNDHSISGDLTTIERALQLARNSTCATLDDIRRTLTREHYAGVDQHLSGTSIKKQLVRLIAQRQGTLPADV